jgi:hypothetical protein
VCERVCACMDIFCLWDVQNEDLTADGIFVSCYTYVNNKVLNVVFETSGLCVDCYCALKFQSWLVF